MGTYTELRLNAPAQRTTGEDCTGAVGGSGESGIRCPSHDPVVTSNVYLPVSSNGIFYSLCSPTLTTLAWWVLCILF